MSAYVIPPVNAESMKATGARFGIAEWQLVSSSVPEAPPAAYSAATAYAAGAEVSSGVVGGVLQVWRSRQAGNQGRPLVEGVWWEYRGDTHALWNAATSYQPGALVLRVETHTIYRRVTAGATTQPPEQDATGVNWVRHATSNRWAMFDMRSGQMTRAVPPLRVVLAPGRITAINLVGMNGGTVKFVMRSAGVRVWDPPARPLDSTVIGSWEDYFFAPFSVRSTLLETEVPSYDDGQLEMTVAAGVDLEVGKMIVGDAVYIGETEIEPRIRRRGFTEIRRNNFSELEDIIPRRSIPIVSQRMKIHKRFIQRARVALELSTAVPSVFVGLDNDQDEYSDLLTILAICNDFEFVPNYEYTDLITETEGV